MRRGRVRLGLFLGLGAVLLVLGCGSRARREDARPNVLLIVVDALRADRLSCYGYGRATSPSIDALAKEGALFRNVMASADETALAVPSLLTSRRPHEHGVRWDVQAQRVEVAVGRGEPTLAEMLGAQGYVTAALSANALLGEIKQVTQGFGSFVAGPWEKEGLASELNARAFQWLDRYDRRRGPFLLYLHYVDPHYPYTPPSAFCRFGRPGYTPRDDQLNKQVSPLFGEYEDRGLRVPPEALARVRASAADVARLSDLYDGEVRGADAAIGELMQRLKRLGLYDNTIIVITADHGESFLEHGHLVHRGSLYQEAVHVPLIVKVPGVTGGRELGDVAETIDVTPTLLEATGVEPRTPLTGRSLYGALARGEKVAPRVAVSELQRGKGRAVRLGQWKLLEWHGRTELYDLQRDPGETHNLAAAHPEQVTRLRAAATESAAEPAAAPRTRPATAEELRALRSLGYVK